MPGKWQGMRQRTLLQIALSLLLPTSYALGRQFVGLSGCLVHVEVLHPFPCTQDGGTCDRSWETSSLFSELMHVHRRHEQTQE